MLLGAVAQRRKKITQTAADSPMKIPILYENGMSASDPFPGAAGAVTGACGGCGDATAPPAAGGFTATLASAGAGPCALRAGLSLPVLVSEPGVDIPLLGNSPPVARFEEDSGAGSSSKTNTTLQCGHSVAVSGTLFPQLLQLKVVIAGDPPVAGAESARTVVERQLTSTSAAESRWAHMMRLPVKGAIFHRG